MKTIDVAQLPSDVAALLTSEEKPVFLEQNGQPIGVIVSPDTYRRWEQQAAVDYSEEWSEEDYRDFAAASWAYVNRRLEEEEKDDSTG